MNKEEITLDDVKKWKWEDIYKRTHIFRTLSQHDFIVFKKVKDKYVLMTHHEIDENNKDFNCYLLPYLCLENLEFHIQKYHNGGFKSYPQYYIASDLYYFRKDLQAYSLLWFANALYDIVKNKDYSIFKRGKNYNPLFLSEVFECLLEICNTEILNKLNIEHEYIYGQTKKYFSPITPIYSEYQTINENLDVSNIDILIDYICLMIKKVKAEYRLITIYYE